MNTKQFDLLAVLYVMWFNENVYIKMKKTLKQSQHLDQRAHNTAPSYGFDCVGSERCGLLDARAGEVMAAEGRLNVFQKRNQLTDKIIPLFVI